MFIIFSFFFFSLQHTIAGTKFKTKSTANNSSTSGVDTAASTDLNNINNNAKLETSEILDLGDLDLSRLRLSKKDLETLSSLTPSLSKDVQEQLLAQLPPTQARKLSRTLSMQNGNSTVHAQQLRDQKVYKRSLSNGSSSSNSNRILDDINKNKYERDSLTPTNDYNDNIKNNNNSSNYNYYRRSLSRGRYDLENNNNNVINSRSSSRCRDSVLSPIIDNSNRFSYGNHPALANHYNNSNINNNNHDNKYKTYTPYSNYNNDNTYDFERSKSLEYENNLNYDQQQSPSCLSPTRELYGRPPSGCISPPPLLGSSSSSYSSQHDPVIRRRSTQKRVSRFLRPDFYDTPKEESFYDGKSEEETQKILREIREKSCDRSAVEQRNKSSDRLSYFIDKYSHSDSSKLKTNKIPLENRYSCFEPTQTPPTDFNSLLEQHEKLLSKSKDDMIDSNNFNGNEKTSSFSDKILEELQNISITNSAIEQNNNKIDKKIKKLKAKTKTETETSVITTKKIVKKVAPKTKSTDIVDGNSNIDKINNNDEKIDTSPETEIKTSSVATRESKLLRPKSYPVKEVEKLATKKQNNSSDLILNTTTETKVASIPANASSDVNAVVNKIVRPKSFPASKLTPPKEVKKSNISSDIQNNNDLVANIDKILVAVAVVDVKQVSPPKDGTEVKKVKKIIKIVKKSSKTPEEKSSTSASSTLPVSLAVTKKEKSSEKIVDKTETPIAAPAQDSAITGKKEKSPEKKPGKGFLYNLGQKIEKFRETTKSKEKKQKEEILNNNNNNENIEKLKKAKKEEETLLKPSHSPSPAPASKSDRSSRIDSVIRNLRELSVPRGPSLTESGLIKRAVSVEEMPNTFNKCSVNKVLGLFKKIESTTAQIAPNNKSTKSTSYINTSSTNTTTTSMTKERPKSSGFVSKLKKQQPVVATTSTDNNIMDANDPRKLAIVNSKIPIKYNNSSCPNCNEHDNDIGNMLNSNIVNNNTNNNINNGNNINNNDINYIVTKRHSTNCNGLTSDAAIKSGNTLMSLEEKERIKNNRKGLMLDFTKLNETNNNNIKGVSNNRSSNSYSFPPPLPNEILAGTATTPTTSSTSTYDNITNYSSGSRSPYDDCGASTASTTFLSPTDEHELYFDDWSVCSDDNNSIIMGGGHSSSSNLSRLSRTSHLNNNIGSANTSESVVDRIRRKSFYTRFNEKKPKRVSNIVGPAAKEYYRDTSTTSTTAQRLKTRPPASMANLSTSASSSTNDYYRLGGNVGGKYEYTNKSNSNISSYLSTSGSSRRLNYGNNINLINNNHNNNNNNTLESNPISSSFYGSSAISSAYNPTKRRSSFTNGPISTAGASSAGSSSLTSASTSSNNFIDSYATIGRKGRAYDHRTVSLLDSSTVLRDPRSGFEHSGSVTR